MAIVLCCTTESQEKWVVEFRRQAPDLDFRVWPDAGDLSEIRHAIVSRPQLGALAQLPNLEVIHSLWAGVDHILRDPDLPTDKPVLRMIDPGLSQGMKEYVTGHVLRYHLKMPFFEAEQAAGRWTWAPPPLAEDRKVGVLGLGTLGQICAEQLVQIGFDVAGWSRSRKEIDGITSFAGDAELADFLARTEILINLLPNTAATNKVLNAETLANMPKGAALINAGRGEAIDDTALVDAVASGHIAGATLDVFTTEPLPADHPYWTTPGITVTPHVAAETRISTGAQTVLRNIADLSNGRDIANLPGLMDRSAGY